MLFDRYPKYKNGLPGHDWDILNIAYKKSNIEMIEDDILALFRYEKDRPKQEDSVAMTDSWLFKPGLVYFTNEESDTANRIYDKMIASGSWILAVAGEYVMAYRAVIFSTMLSVLKEMQNKEEDSSEDVKTLAGRMESKHMRRAANLRENCVLEYAAENLKGFEAAGDISKFKL